MGNETVVGEGNLVSIKEPKFLSLVGRPANKVSFRVVRSEDGDHQPNGATTMKPHVVRRQRRSDPSPILQLSFPSGYTDAQVTDQLKAFSLDGYDVIRQDDGTVSAIRSDVKSISPASTVAIKLTADGITATVNRSDSAEPANPKAHLTVAKVVLDGGALTQDALNEWAQKLGATAENSMSAVEGTEATFEVVRSEVPEGEETRTIELEPGVTAVVFRSDTTDIPDGFVAVVNETCYGNWGWGQLDFAAAMADYEFTEAMDDATYRLRRVLDDILLYSALPLAERKTLMVNALAQYQSFAVGILDSLPRTVLVAVARSANPQLEKTQTMSKNATSGGAGTTTQTTASPDQTPVTRSELDAAVSKITADVIAALKPTVTAQRSDGGEGEGGDTKPAATTSPAPTTTEAVLTRDDLTAAVTAAIQPVTERLAVIEGRTVVRADLNADQTVTTTTAPAAAGAAKTGDVFRGAPVFAGLGLPRRATPAAK